MRWLWIVFVGLAVPCALAQCAGDEVCTYDTECEGGMICRNGKCVTPADPCEGKVCDPGYECRNGDCVLVDPCAGVVCDSPEGDAVCFELPGTCDQGRCEYTALADGLDCDDGDACTFDTTCQGGACLGQTVTCESPPPRTCIDDRTLRSYASAGTCVDGECRYEHQDHDCPDGCQDGACNNDPCVGVSCDDPPAAACESETGRRYWSAPGECVDGDCIYPDHFEDCSAGATNRACVGGACGCRDGGDCADGEACGTNSRCELIVYRTLAVTLGGHGGGTVDSDPAGMHCTGGYCEAVFLHGSQLTLSATPNADSVFDEWRNDCSGSSPTCVVTMDGDKDVLAMFEPEPATYTLSVTIGGHGGGTVDSDPAGMHCTGGFCQADFAEDSQVTLSATPRGDSVFADWHNECAGTDPSCVVSMTADRAVLAMFDLKRYTVTVTVGGYGTNTVYSDPAGINCSQSQCSADFDAGTQITLTAEAGLNARFDMWLDSDVCSGSDPVCEFTLQGDEAATALFEHAR
ncbi:MAG: hypothetical protein JXR96_03950 [Deltaproteobacteria bacterium]|nr:hypothetical protein [Deltaproteobacteria bacterium]